nr:fructose-specific PTS transporter subunit EIIC [Spiroplasma clarkii]
MVAVTACVVGVAHTYMAEEKLLSELTNAGYQIRVETQGSKGVGTELTAAEIKNADLVILATDTNVDKSRFVGKRVYQTHVARAIKEPLKVVADAQAQAVVMKADQDFTTETKKDRQGVIKHILAGISYMIPIIIAGGVLIAASLGIAKAIWGAGASTTGVNNEYPHNPLWAMEQIGGAAFTLMIPILAAFIANSIGGRAAIAPALVGGFIGNDASKFVPMFGMNTVTTPMGFIGAIIAGLLVGYFTLWVNSWRVPKSLRAAMPIFFIPIVGSIAICVLFMYVLGGPIGFVMDKLSAAIEKGYTSDQFGIGLGLGLGILLGAMAGFDMGGPVNKIAFVTSSALVVQKIYYPMGAMAAAIPVAPLGMGLSAVLFKRFFTREEKAAGISALIMGMIGISEGAIPFAIRDPKRAIACNVLGSAIAGAIAGALKVENYAAHGGPIVAILGAVPYGVQTFYFFLAILIGTTVSVVVYGLWLVATLGKLGSVKEAYVNLCVNYKTDAKDKKYALAQQIKTLKNNIKASTDEKEAQGYQQQIESLKTQFDPINNTLKEQLLGAKKAYQEVVGAEKVGVKAKMGDFTKFIQEQKANKQSQLKAIQTEYQTNSTNADKYKNVLWKKHIIMKKKKHCKGLQIELLTMKLICVKNM